MRKHKTLGQSESMGQVKKRSHLKNIPFPIWGIWGLCHNKYNQGK